MKMYLELEKEEYDKYNDYLKNREEYLKYKNMTLFDYLRANKYKEEDTFISYDYVLSTYVGIQLFVKDDTKITIRTVDKSSRYK